MSSGSEVFRFGKHKDKNFEHVYAKEKGYVKWAQSEARDGQLAEFVSYCQARDSAGCGTASASNHQRPSANSTNVPAVPASSSMSAMDGSFSFSFGKHKGKSFAQVYEQERGPKGYVEWVRLEPRYGELQQFLDYCNARDGRPPLSGQLLEETPKHVGGAAAAGVPVSPVKRPRGLDAQEPPIKRPSLGGAAEDDEDIGCEKCHSPDLPFPGAKRCGSCWKKYYRTSDERFYIACTFGDREVVKARGARWDPELKKWFVPPGKDISMLEKWLVVCTRCGEPLSNLKLSRLPVCIPECKSDVEHREREERKEQEEKELEALAKLRAEDAERRKKELKAKIKIEFLSFVRREAAKIQAMMVERNNDAKENEEKVMPYTLVEGGLESHVERGIEAGTSYNPFSTSDASVLPPSAVSWMRSIGSKDFAKDSGMVCSVMYTPAKILDWAITFHGNFIETWIDESADMRMQVRKQEQFIQHLLSQCLDPITPDLKLLIQEKLKTVHGTSCPDVVGIFGSKILPRIRLTLGDAAFQDLSLELKRDWCVGEYMQNRKGYDSACQETEQTTYMRDVLNQVIESLLEGGSLKTELNEDETDALYFRADENDQQRMFMLRNPNTAAVDVFSMEIVEEAAQRMREGKGPSEQKMERSQHAGVGVPTVQELRARIFAVFRILHWRIVRKIGGGSYAVYGVDQGLRQEDGDSRMTKVMKEFPAHHNAMLNAHWAPRDFCGHVSKRLHSNTELIELLFVEHLKLDDKLIKKMRKEAEKQVNKLRKEQDKEQRKLKNKLKEAGIKSTDLASL